MTKLMFLPIADQIESGTYLLYDCACGTGGMLTVAEETLQQIAAEHEKQIATHLYGQEINAETYAICKADLLLKGEGVAADNIVGGPEHSTLSNDAFPSREFDFMLANPPYGKSWKSDLERMGGKKNKKDIHDSRFIIEHGDDPEYSLITRSKDGQMMFLANMLSKMKQNTKLGSRIAEVHNGSSLFTGDAESGESNIRRWIIENDWLEAIVALPLNMFYNTGIATYVWVLSNRKPEHRIGKVQLIDATEWYQPLRKNLGDKNCELGEADIQKVCEAFLGFMETEESKIFDNDAFGYWKVTVERPLRLAIHTDSEHLATLAEAAVEEKEQNLESVVDAVTELMGDGPHRDANQWLSLAERVAKGKGMRWTAKKRKLLRNHLGEKDESAQPLIAKMFKADKQGADPLKGFFTVELDEGKRVVQYEPDPDLRDSEQIPLQEEGGIEAFLTREVLPHTDDAWYVAEQTKIGYEISFTRHFYKPQPMRSLKEICADILALEKESVGVLDQIFEEASP